MIDKLLRSRFTAGTVLVVSVIAACHRGASTPPAPANVPETPTAPPPATPAAPTNPLAALYSDTGVTPVRSPEAELATFRLADGYRAELVAAEPLVQDPVAIDFDADGRMYVVEMRGFMPNIKGEGEDKPVGRIVVLEDTDDDGRMDKKTVFLDGLVLPRAIKVLEHGVLVGAPPNLWLARDTTGDLKADTRELVRDDYGTTTSNPEHNANGLLWGIDNWIHNANYAGEFRLRPDGKFDLRKTPSVGQWGVSADDWGRLYRNFNEDPLHADLVPTHYAGRDAAPPNMRGIYERLTPNIPVWPAHKTPAVNRGYRINETLRPDSTLAHYTSAGSPTTYVGDRLPNELRASVFVTEPAGNLVGRFVVDEREDGFPTAHSAYDRAEFMTGADERFRPVNVATAPDGTLYVVDMYRGIIQHRAYITGYLEEKIKERGMEQPIGLGRIWRIVHTSTRRGEKPQLSRKTSAELVPVLAHPNGWWRITAQRLLVERGDRAVAPALREMARTARDERARLHALWTLDGLGDADAPTVDAALGDSSAWVRAAAVRIAEPRLARGEQPLLDHVLRLAADRSAVVARQVAASSGELPAARREAALADVVASHGDDPIVADLAVSALPGRHVAFLERVLAPRAPNAPNTPNASDRAATVRALAAAVFRSRDAAGAERVVALAGEASRPRWQRLALLEGASMRAGGRGEPPAEGGLVTPEAAGPRRMPTGPALSLPHRPAALLATAESKDTALSARARRVAESLAWPGKSAPAAPAARPLTAAERARYAAGQQQYLATCAGCHQPNGMGLPGVAKPLAGSAWAQSVPARVIRIVLHGKEGQMLMPPIGASLSDEQIANILTYVRRSWGNSADPIDPTQVREIRGATAGRTKPWTEAELSRINR